MPAPALPLAELEDADPEPDPVAEDDEDDDEEDDDELSEEEDDEEDSPLFASES